jgi:hypothetical protein
MQYIQLEAAARQVGKSEITLRRLIKAAKISHRKERTITGFVYLVSPEEVLAYYQQGGLGGVIEEAMAEDVAQHRVSPQESPEPGDSARQRQVQVSVESTAPDMSEYWQKRSEVYEDRYNQEVIRHTQVREELGSWRGKAEQTQEMLSKLLPAMAETQQQAATVAEAYTKEIKKARSTITWLSVVTSALFVTLVITVALFVYLRWFRG